MRRTTQLALGTLLCITAASTPFAQDGPAAPSVHLVWMGGNDCPPCVWWRRTELPKLKESAAFQAIQFSYVTKPIASAVPPRFFLPSEVKPLKDLLDTANAGRKGSPQAALVVNGAVHDYFVGTRTAAQIEQMLVAVKSGTPYPFTRCMKLSTESGKCETVGEQ